MNLSEKFKKIKIKQGSLFYVYNLFIPLVLPLSFIIVLANYYIIDLGETIMALLSQIFLYNTIVLSTNIGLLSVGKENNELKKKNIAWSICLLTLNLFLYFIILMTTFNGNKIFFNSLLPILAWVVFSLSSIVIIYPTLLLLSKNKRAAFVSISEPDIGKLSKKRESSDNKLISDIKHGEVDDNE